MSVRPPLLPRWIALVVFAAAPLASAARAQEPASAAPAGADRSARTSVATELAARWGVGAEQVVLDWGAAGPRPGRLVRLLGNGAAGAYVAELEAGGDVVRRRVRAGVRLALPIAARELARGTVLTEADIARVDTVAWGAPRGLEPARPGWVVRRRMGAGVLLAPPAVAPPLAVSAGDPVTLVWRGGRVELKARGVAAGSAPTGGRVAVRTASGRRIWGVADGPGTVRIDGGAR